MPSINKSIALRHLMLCEPKFFFAAFQDCKTEEVEKYGQECLNHLNAFRKELDATLSDLVVAPEEDYMTRSNVKILPPKRPGPPRKLLNIRSTMMGSKMHSFSRSNARGASPEALIKSADALIRIITWVMEDYRQPLRYCAMETENAVESA